MKSHHMEMDEKWAEEGRGVGEKGGNWRALPADMNGRGGTERKKGREEVKDERRGTGE